jgi:hypothetical protein
MAISKAKAQSKAQNKPGRLYRTTSALEPAQAVPVVTSKRRRVFVMPTGDKKSEGK